MTVAVLDQLRAALPPGECEGFDISALDRLGLPVFTADHVGPGTPPSGGIGYGYTLEQASIGAYGELVESLLLHGHLQTLTPRRASYGTLRRELGSAGVVDPRALVLSAGTVVDDDQPRDWLPAVRWRTGETVLLPAEFCGSGTAHLPRQDPAEPLIKMITNGDGAGDTAERAIAHGLLELLQRDGNGTAFRALDRGVVLDLDDVGDPITNAVLDRIRAAGIEVLAKLASTQFGMADVYVVGIDHDPATEPLAIPACGEAVHPDREFALRKALLEYASARSRRVFMHGPLERLRPLAPESYWARERTLPVSPQEPRALTAMRDWSRRTPAELLALLEPSVFSRHSRVAFSELPTVGPGSLDDPAELLDELLTRLADFDVLVVLAPGDGAVAAKVIVPGLEVETMSYGRIGARGVKKLIAHRSDLAGLGAPPHSDAVPVVLTAEGRNRLGGEAWLDLAAVARAVGPLYPLYREPDRHALARTADTA
ncbi:MAG: YcaO-like family protein [Pseudonocardiaceae bacterium]